MYKFDRQENRLAPWLYSKAMTLALTFLKKSTQALYSSNYRFALVFLVLLTTLGISQATLANTIQLTVNNQTPVNVVPEQTPVTYGIVTGNVNNDINPPSSIGVGIRVQVNGNTVSASSGEFSSSGCRIDPSFQDVWACNNLSEGGSQRPTFTWNSPSPGTSTVTFVGFCQLLNDNGGPFDPAQLCSSTSSESISTIVDENNPGSVQPVSSAALCWGDCPRAVIAPRHSRPAATRQSIPVMVLSIFSSCPHFPVSRWQQVHRLEFREHPT